MKSSRKSEKSSKKISTPSKSQPDGDPTEPNVVLTMVLDEAIAPQPCEDLKRTLQGAERLYGVKDDRDWRILHTQMGVDRL